MQTALQQFGDTREMENIENTINNTDVVQNLIDLYNNKKIEYPTFKTDDEQTEIHNMYDFLTHVDDVDMGGVSECFVNFK